MEKQESLADALRGLSDELAIYLNDRDTSVPDEDVEIEPLRGSPLYVAVQAVEAHFPGRKLAVAPWADWVQVLIRTDECKGEADLQLRLVEVYRLLGKLQAWAQLARANSSVVPVESDELTIKQREALRIIRDDGPIQGKLLAKQINVSQSTLRRHILPSLKGYGVKNDRDGRGYYVAR